MAYRKQKRKDEPNVNSFENTGYKKERYSMEIQEKGKLKTEVRVEKGGIMKKKW